MSPSGMARKVDDLGRIVLPVEMRRLFGIQAGDALEIAVEDRGIVLRKVETRCVFCEGTEALRSYRDKQLCSSCAAGLAVPAVSEPAVSEPAGGEPAGGEPAVSVPAGGEPAGDQSADADEGRAHVFEALPTPEQFAEQLPAPAEVPAGGGVPSGAEELDQPPAPAPSPAAADTGLPPGEAQGDVVDAPPWHS